MTEMNILALCSALDNSYIAFKYNNNNYSKIIKSDKNYHSLYLIKDIKDILIEKSLKLDDFDLFTVNCGPGSFTGIRVALTISKIIAGELNKPLIPLNTAEILLNAYNSDYLFMDARRDMYFIGNKEKIELVPKDTLVKSIDNYKDKNIVCDKRCLNLFDNAVCYEEKETDLGSVMLKLAEEKFKTGKESDFNYMNVKANYIQTPPVF